MPRPWSRHSLKKKEDSSLEEKKVTSSKVSKDVEQVGKSKKNVKDGETEDPQFQEFLEVMQHRSKSKLWANDTVSAVSREQSNLVSNNKYKGEEGEGKILDDDLESTDGEIDSPSEKTERPEIVQDAIVSDTEYRRLVTKEKWSDSESSDDESYIDGTDHSDNDNDDGSGKFKDESSRDPAGSTIKPYVSNAEAEDGSSKERVNGSDEPSSCLKNENVEFLETSRLFIRNLPYTATYVPCYLLALSLYTSFYVYAGVSATAGSFIFMYICVWAIQ